ncbi:cupin-like domain-containing protein [Thalassomonas sp. RHCl1]|uniref:cupin-like domain-containing protein n=1 Tax=Thalassomonas sp. RHCl1 TaxID=2995320 RepID=UPI00248CDB38|nr:cupin-like domain-containing protein [Thalassomonas sp. RHCl1]
MTRWIEEYNKNNISDFASYISNHYAPVVIRNLVDSWPAVEKGKQGDEAFARYLRAFCNNSQVPVILMAPQHQGRIFYNHDFEGFNFQRRNGTISAVAKQLIAYLHVKGASPTLAVQSAPVKQCLPEFLTQNPSPAFLSKVSPRIWLGNKALVPAHYDESHNIACVISGKRRFTLFPPEQIKNLYVGPIDYTPTGPAISLVDVNNPDLEKHPRFEQALSHAYVAELEPGDGLYIPPLWWHQVEASGGINTLVNYWWGGSIELEQNKLAPVDSMMHALLTIKDLPVAERLAWRSFYDHYVFQTGGDPLEHVPASKKGILAKNDNGTEAIGRAKASVVNWLIKQLEKHR